MKFIILNNYVTRPLTMDDLLHNPNLTLHNVEGQEYKWAVLEFENPDQIHKFRNDIDTVNYVKERVRELEEDREFENNDIDYWAEIFLDATPGAIEDVEHNKWLVIDHRTDEIYIFRNDRDLLSNMALLGITAH